METTTQTGSWKTTRISFLDEEARLRKDVLKGKLASDTMTDLPAHIQVLPMSENELRGLEIGWSEADTVFGKVLLASTGKGICYAGFVLEDPEAALRDLKRRFPKAAFVNRTDLFQEQALAHFQQPQDNDTPLTFHLKGTAFQLDIWKELLRIPFGAVTSYGTLGGGRGRATGTAVGDNPVSYLIPCHRVIRGDGSFQGYFWGNALKRKLLCLESINARS